MKKYIFWDTKYDIEMDYYSSFILAQLSFIKKY